MAKRLVILFFFISWKLVKNKIFVPLFRLLEPVCRTGRQQLQRFALAGGDTVTF